MSRDSLVGARGPGPSSSSSPSSATLHQEQQQQRQRQELQNRRALTTLTLGLAQACAALSWGNGIGVSIGAATFTAATFTVSASATPRWARRSAQALSIYALVLLVVRLASRDPQVASFPAGCPPGLQGTHGCSRVAADGESSHRAPPAPLDVPFRKRALLSDVEGELLRWVELQSRRVTVLKHEKPSSKDREAGGGFLHVRAVTALMGFADDFFLSYRCLEGEAVVELQGQLRLGVGDAGVNTRRNAAVLAHLRAAAAAAEDKGGLPAADACR